MITMITMTTSVPMPIYTVIPLIERLRSPACYPREAVQTSPPPPCRCWSMAMARPAFTRLGRPGLYHWQPAMGAGPPARARGGPGLVSSSVEASPICVAAVGAAGSASGFPDAASHTGRSGRHPWFMGPFSLDSRKFQMSGSWPFFVDWRTLRPHPLFTGTDPLADG